MDTNVKLFRYNKKLSSIGLGEPSITLIENDSAFGAFIAESAHQDSFTHKLHLDQVTLVRVRGKKWSFHDFPEIALYELNGVWIAEDTRTRKIFHEPSVSPYHVIFISLADFSRLMHAKLDNTAKPIFDYIQKHFGKLPGFACSQNTLETPDDYAQASGRLQNVEYVISK